MFMWRILLFCVWMGSLSCRAEQVVWEDEDRQLFSVLVERMKKAELDKFSGAERMLAVGSYLTGTPYLAGTLDNTTEERLVICFKSLDCVTFVDVVLALSMLEQYEGDVVRSFEENLRRIRYRDGEILNYTSRLHYSSDWLYEMERCGILKDVSRQCGGIPYAPTVFYMSENYRRYPAMRRDSLLAFEMSGIENRINERSYFFIPKEQIEGIAEKINAGDIILITTGIAGLDTSHIGIAVKKEGKVFLMHASSTNGKVEITQKPLAEYMADIRSQTGIMIARMIE